MLNASCCVLLVVVGEVVGRGCVVAQAHCPAGSSSGGSSSGGSKFCEYRSLFSSCGGMVTSTDDWYQLSSGLLVTETTISAVDARALSVLRPSHGVPAWLRVAAANALASSGPSWVELFKLHNGGSYNCMWMILDARAAAAKLRPASGPAPASLADIPDGTLTLLEPVPAEGLGE